MFCLSPIRLKAEGKLLHKFKDGYYYVPCSKCPACIDKLRKEWFVRLNKQTQASYNSYFITLTYSDEHIPSNYLGYPTFSKSDVQRFIKRLRKRFENETLLDRPFKYFLASEYGSELGRPHYHALFFDVPPNIDLWRFVHKTWGKGRITVSPVTKRRIGYLVNYMYAKSKSRECPLPPEELMDDSNKIFVLCSKGMGKDWLSDAMIKKYKSTLDTFVIQDGLTYKLPRYYQDKMFDESEKDSIFRKKQSFIAKKLQDEILKRFEYYQKYGDPSIPEDTEVKKYLRNFYNRVKKHRKHNGTIR